jgi:hypothetical protein
MAAVTPKATAISKRLITTPFVCAFCGNEQLHRLQRYSGGVSRVGTRRHEFSEVPMHFL